jgi:hypothetical protein
MEIFGKHDGPVEYTANAGYAAAAMP